MISVVSGNLVVNPSICMILKHFDLKACLNV